MPLLLLACVSASPEGDENAPDETTPDDTGTAPLPSYCPAAESGVLQDVTGTPASPYFVRHPAVAADDTPTVVFLPGGDGSSQNAQGVSRNYLSGDGADAFRLVIPYTDGSAGWNEDASRAASVRDEVLACFGGDPDAVHLGGVSNGGLGSFDLFVDVDGAGFASLLGAPGAWESFREEKVATALGEKPLYMAVGELDDGWRDGVEDQASALEALGVDVTFVVFEGQEHVVDEAFDETVLFDFWRAATP